MLQLYTISCFYVSAKILIIFFEYFDEIWQIRNLDFQCMYKMTGQKKLEC
jgi:hypothetical protein